MHSFHLLSWYDWLVILPYVLCLLFIFGYSMAQLHLVWQVMHSKASPADTLSIDQWPSVTVQLPLYNERYVAERLINCVGAMDYPIDRLQIQVLDDSTDDTTGIANAALRRLEDIGIDVELVHRVDRVGYKAGALANGLHTAKGSFIAIFDADFMPGPDFLKSTIKHFTAPEIGLVQTRWEHLNDKHSLLTRMQAFGLNAHFTIEQRGRNEAGAFINFNGTAGVWRKRCIQEAGGWSSDTLTEDLDLSYRAQLAGWRFVYRDDVGAPAELPEAMHALKTQQFRWTKGAAECAIKNLGAVWRDKSISIQTKVHGLFHLMNSFIFICVLVTAILSVPMMFIKQKLLNDIAVSAFGSLFIACLLALIIFYWTSFKKSNPNQNAWHFLAVFCTFLSMSMGLSLHNSMAVFEGYIGRKSPFIRTPKLSFKPVGENIWKSNVYMKARISWFSVLELLVGVFFIGAMGMGVWLNDYGLLPFHLMLSIGFLLVGGMGIIHAIKSKETPMIKESI